jgi:two-component system chemotaxis response regulator CheB
MSLLKVVIVDDSVIFRKIIRDAFANIPGIDIVGIAADGMQGLDRVRRMQPHMVTLDVEMPNMDGISFLKQLKQEKLSTKVVMLSGLSEAGAKTTMDSLSEGAFDFIVKPNGPNLETNIKLLSEALASRVDGIRASLATESRGSVPPRPPSSTPRYQSLRTPAAFTPTPTTTAPTATATATTIAAPVNYTPRTFGSIKHPADIIALGISTGGPQALRSLLPQLPANLAVPMVIVQHMPPVFTKSLATSLNSLCAITVKEAEDGDRLQPATAYIAPGGKQMRIRRDGEKILIQITEDPPENACKPAVDYLFRSVLDCYGPRTLGVIMTGMGSDGTAACRMISKAGGRLLAQDAGSCVVYGMPKLITEEQLIEESVPLERMALAMMTRVRGG